MIRQLKTIFILTITVFDQSDQISVETQVSFFLWNSIFLISKFYRTPITITYYKVHLLQNWLTKNK